MIQRTLVVVLAAFLAVGCSQDTSGGSPAELASLEAQLNRLRTENAEDVADPQDDLPPVEQARQKFEEQSGLRVDQAKFIVAGASVCDQLMEGKQPNEITTAFFDPRGSATLAKIIRDTPGVCEN